MIHVLGMLLDFGKRKKPLACGSYRLHFLKVEQHPTCMDHAILHGKPLLVGFATNHTSNITSRVYPWKSLTNAIYANYVVT